MAEFVELRPLPQPRKVAELAPQASLYKSYRNLKGKNVAQKEVSNVAAMEFCPAAPHRIAVASGTKVTLFKQNMEGEPEADGQISKFKDMTQCVAWRGDGRLLLAGEAGGSCAVVETDTRKVLRRFRGHGDAVTCAAFATSDRTRAATGARDGRLRLWDVTSSDLLQTIDAHTDCLKFVSPGPGGADSWITAGYDGMLKLWELSADEKVTEPVLALDHGAPIECAVVFPGGAMVATGGGPAVKLWDLASGKLLNKLTEAHSKTVTSLCLDSQATVLLTASFDCMVKVYHAASLEFIHSYRLAAPVICAAWRPDDKCFLLGLDNGTWIVKHRRTEEDVAAACKRASKLAEEAKAKKSMVRRKTIGNLRGLDREAASDEEIVEPDRPQKKKETQLDFFLRKFEYKKAAEVLVSSSTTAAQGFALVDELIHRGALATALKDRDEAFCLQALKWLLRVFAAGNNYQTRLFFEMLHTLLDNNHCLQPPTTPEMVNALTSLDSKVAEEISVQDALAETSGMLHSIMSL